MNILYILQNQDGYFLGNKGLLGRGASKTGATKEHEWVDGREAGAIFRAEYKDEAINMRVEINSQDIYARITIKEVESTLKRHPVIVPEDLPPPLPKNTEDLDVSLSNDIVVETSTSDTINESLEPSAADDTGNAVSPIEPITSV